MYLSKTIYFKFPITYRMEVKRLFLGKVIKSWQTCTSKLKTSVTLIIKEEKWHKVTPNNLQREVKLLNRKQNYQF